MSRPNSLAVKDIDIDKGVFDPSLMTTKFNRHRKHVRDLSCGQTDRQIDRHIQSSELSVGPFSVTQRNPTRYN